MFFGGSGQPHPRLLFLLSSLDFPMQGKTSEWFSPTHITKSILFILLPWPTMESMYLFPIVYVTHNHKQRLQTALVYYLLVCRGPAHLHPVSRLWLRCQLGCILLWGLGCYSKPMCWWQNSFPCSFRTHVACVCKASKRDRLSCFKSLTSEKAWTLIDLFA